MPQSRPQIWKFFAAIVPLKEWAGHMFGFNWRAIRYGLRSFVFAIGLSALAPVHAEETLRYGLSETLGYPLNRLHEKGAIADGLLKEMGEKIARELNVPLQLVPLSRRRIEPSLVDGSVDLVCYHSPQWTATPQAFDWSIPSLPQVERTIAMKGAQLSGNIATDFAQKAGDFADRL